MRTIRLLLYSFIFVLNMALAAETSTDVSKRLTFINAALQYHGTPYRYAGNSRKGIDCSGLVCACAADALDLTLSRRSDAMARHAKTVADKEVLPGDLLFFKTTSRISHVGIYLGAGQFIHSASDGPATGVIISTIQEAYWNKTYDHAGRILPVESIFTAEKQGISVMLRTNKNSSLHPDIKMP